MGVFDKIHIEDAEQYIPMLLRDISTINFNQITKKELCCITAILYLKSKLDDSSLALLEKGLRLYPKKLQAAYQSIVTQKDYFKDLARKNLKADDFTEFLNNDSTYALIGRETAQQMGLEMDSLSSRSNSRNSSSSSLSSLETSAPVAVISSDRQKLIKEFQSKTYSRSFFASNEEKENTELKNEAIQVLISELQDSNKKISEIRSEPRTINARLSTLSVHSGYTIDQVCDEETKKLLDKVQEKEEGKLKEEKNLIPTLQPLKENERENKVGFIIIHASNIFDANDFSGLSLNNLKILKNQIAQIIKLKDELIKHGQPLEEDDIKNYDQNNINIVGANAASYWNICEQIDEKYAAVESALKTTKSNRLNKACEGLKIICENMMLDIYQEDMPGVIELPSNYTSIEKLKSLNELLEILKNDTADPEKRLYQFTNKIYGNENFNIVEDKRKIFLNNVAIFLSERPKVAVAILLEGFKDYRQYMFENGAGGGDTGVTPKWKQTQDIIAILENKDEPAEKLKQVNQIISGPENVLMKARNPLAWFINALAWLKKQFSSSAPTNNVTVSWDIASSQSKGAGVVRVAEGVLPKPLKNQ